MPAWKGEYPRHSKLIQGVIGLKVAVRFGRNPAGETERSRERSRPRMARNPAIRPTHMSPPRTRPRIVRAPEPDALSHSRGKALPYEARILPRQKLNAIEPHRWVSPLSTPSPRPFSRTRKWSQMARFLRCTNVTLVVNGGWAWGKSLRNLVFWRTQIHRAGSFREGRGQARRRLRSRDAILENPSLLQSDACEINRGRGGDGHKDPCSQRSQKTNDGRGLKCVEHRGVLQVHDHAAVRRGSTWWMTTRASRKAMMQRYSG